MMICERPPPLRPFPHFKQQVAEGRIVEIGVALELQAGEREVTAYRGVELGSGGALFELARLLLAPSEPGPTSPDPQCKTTACSTAQPCGVCGGGVN